MTVLCVPQSLGFGVVTARAELPPSERALQARERGAGERVRVVPEYEIRRTPLIWGVGCQVRLGVAVCRLPPPPTLGL